MNIQEEELTANHRRIVIDVSPEDYLGSVDQEIKALSKRVQLDGFRTGKVPVGITRKFYGNAVLVEELNKIVNNAADQFIKEKEWKLLGSPLPYRVKDQTIDIAHPDHYVFGFEVGIVPDFRLADLKAQQFQKQAVIVTDKMIDDEVDRLQSIYGERSYPEQSADGDILNGEWKELNDDDTEKENGIASSSSFSLNVIKEDAVKTQLLNLKKDESVDLSIHSAFDNNEELIVHNILKIDHHAAHEMGDRFRFTLRNIIHIEKSEVNQGLFDKAFGKDAVGTEHDFRQKIKEELDREFDRVSVSRLKNDVQAYLLNNSEMELPSDFLVRYLEENREQKEKPMDENSVQNELTHTKWNLIAGRVQRDQQLEIKDEDLRLEAEKEIRAYFGVNPYFDDRPDDLKNLVASVLKDEKSVNRIYSRLLDERVWNWILNDIQTGTQEVSEEEFYKEQHHH